LSWLIQAKNLWGYSISSQLEIYYWNLKSTYDWWILQHSHYVLHPSIMPLHPLIPLPIPSLHQVLQDMHVYHCRHYTKSCHIILNWLKSPLHIHRQRIPWAKSSSVLTPQCGNRVVQRVLSCKLQVFLIQSTLHVTPIFPLVLLYKLPNQMSLVWFRFGLILSPLNWALFTIHIMTMLGFLYHRHAIC